MNSIPWTEVLFAFCIALELGALIFFVPFTGPFPSRNREHILEWADEIKLSTVTNIVLYIVVLLICGFAIWNNLEYRGTSLVFAAWSSLRFGAGTFFHSGAKKNLARLLIRFPQKKTTRFCGDIQTRGRVRVT